SPARAHAWRWRAARAFDQGLRSSGEESGRRSARVRGSAMTNAGRVDSTRNVGSDEECGGDRRSGRRRRGLERRSDVAVCERIVMVVRQRREMCVSMMPARVTTMDVVVMVVIVIADEERVDVIVIAAFVSVRDDLWARDGGRDDERRENHDRADDSPAHAR